MQQLLFCSIVMQNIQIFFGGPVMFVVTWCFSFDRSQNLFCSGFPLGGEFMLLSQFSNDLPSNPKGHSRFHCTIFNYSFAACDGRLDYLTDVSWEHIFKLGASAAALEFFE